MKRAKYISNGTITYKIIGEQGPPGPQGPAGPQGPQGPKGDKGDLSWEAVNEIIQSLGYATPEMFGAVADGVTDDTVAIKEAIKTNKTVKFNKGKKYLIKESLIVSNGLKIIGNSSTIIAAGDFAIFKNVLQNSERLNGVSIEGIELHKNAGNEWHIDFSNPYLCSVKDCVIVNDSENINANLKSGIKFFNVNSETCFVNVIENNRFEKASIYFKSTDSRIANNVIWAYTQDCGIYLDAANDIDISGNQIVGGAEKGAIYFSEQNACGLVRIVNNFFDGSYEGIETNSGITGFLVMSEITINTFYNQSRCGIEVINPTRNIIANNNFMQNNKGDNADCADIKFTINDESYHQNNVNNNIHHNFREFTNDYYVYSCDYNSKEKCITNYSYNSSIVGSKYKGFFNGDMGAGQIFCNYSCAEKLEDTYRKFSNTIVDSGGVYLKQFVTGSSCDVDLKLDNCNINIAANGEYLVGTLEKFKPRSEKWFKCVEYSKNSSISMVIQSDGKVKLRNWNDSSIGTVTIKNLRCTANFAIETEF